MKSLNSELMVGVL